jgi:SAM-dependent methyltransferase
MPPRVVEPISPHPSATRNRLLKAVKAYQQGGAAYLWHKSLRRALEEFPTLKRRLLYADPRHYWTLRGGTEYLAEQEGQPARTSRSLWIASRIAQCQPLSVLEVGCGYGKQLQNIRAATNPEVNLTGIDFSPSQLALAQKTFLNDPNVALVHGSGCRLPFADHSFDLVLTSAVILHNPPEVANAIRLEILRVARHWCVHNEDTDITYNRYGYDTAAWYRSRGLNVLEADPIPPEVLAASDDPAGESARSQFCVVRLS